MIPLRDANPTRRTPVVTLAIIAAATVAFAYELGIAETCAAVTEWGLDVLPVWLEIWV